MARPAAGDLPTGIVTFFFSDIEGSTRLLQVVGSRYRDVLADHGRLVREALAAHRGVEVSTEGDAFFAVFPSPSDAVAAAVQAQRALAAQVWPPEVELRVRIGLHTGAGELGGDNYAGIDVNRAARIAAAGHGGQILLSEATAALVARSLPDDVQVRDLGTHGLKDLLKPERLLQLVIAGLPDRFPPPRSLDAPRTNLPPPPMSSLIGRDEDVEQVLRRLQQTRLVTLTGPGGTGKTRLSLEVARNAVPRFPDGVYLVNLDPISDAALVATAMAQALGVREQGRSAEEALGAELAGKDLLLVLDNFEHVVAAVALVERLLQALPRLRFLVTSRIPLQLYGEHEYPVGPLAVPPADARASLAELAGYEAVELFVERARAVDPRFELTLDTVAAVAEICQRLDGLPLAIELAAARVKLLRPAAILGRLDRRLELLSSRSPNLPPRQRSMRAAIDGSWELLDDQEQRLLERLAVFSGGWDLPAAEAVCGPDLRIDVLDGLASLLDKSLLRRTGDAEERFGMLQTIQEYALERLANRSEPEASHERHAAFFRDLVEAAERDFAGPDPAACVRRLLPDQDNIRAALEWAIASGEADTGMRLASAFWRFWQERGQLREGRTSVERLLSLPSAAAPTALRARALTAAAGLAYWQGDSAARTYYEEALAIYRSLRDVRGIADSLHNLAFTVLSSDREAGIGLLEESLAQFRRLGDERSIASVVGVLSYAQLMAGQYEAAKPGLEEALALNIAHGVRGRANDNRFALGHVHRLRGDHLAAAACYQEALLDVRAMDDASRLLMQLRAVAAFTLDVGRREEALRLAGAVERAREEQGGTIAVPLPGVADPVEVARAEGMPEADIRAWLGAGREMDLAAAADLALTVLAAGSSHSPVR